MKKTNMKVEVKYGQRYITRTVYTNESGEMFFKHDNEWNLIRKRERGGYDARWYNNVKFI